MDVQVFRSIPTKSVIRKTILIKSSLQNQIIISETGSSWFLLIIPSNPAQIPLLT